MSLIDEALKRARHEASRQEAVKRDAARHDGPRPLPRLYAERRTSRAPLWAGISTGAAVALLGVIAWLLWGRSIAPPAAPALPTTPVAAETTANPDVKPATGVALAPVPAAPAATTPPTAVRSEEPVAVARVAPQPTAQSAPATPTATQLTAGTTPSALPRTLPVAPTAPPIAAPAPTQAPRSQAPPSAASPTTPGTAPQTYVREVSLPGGGPRLRLGGIAYSTEAPIALINGAALGRGEVVEGYVVRRIDAAEVELEGPAGRLVLRLK